MRRLASIWAALTKERTNAGRFGGALLGLVVVVFVVTIVAIYVAVGDQSTAQEKQDLAGAIGVGLLLAVVVTIGVVKNRRTPPLVWAGVIASLIAVAASAFGGGTWWLLFAAVLPAALLLWEHATEGRARED